MAKKKEVLINIEDSGTQSYIPKRLTILPLKDVVIYPNMIFPILIGRVQSLKSVSVAVDRDKYIMVITQKDNSVEEPSFDDLYNYGTICKIIQVLRLPNNLLKVLVEGVSIGKITKKHKNKEFLEVDASSLFLGFDENDKELMATVRHSSDLFSEYVQNSPQLPQEIIGAYTNLQEPFRKVFYGAANIQTSIANKQKILEAGDLKQIFYQFASVLTTELELLKLEDEIDTKIHDTIQKTQKKYYIQEQIRALQKELGDEDDSIPEILAIKEAIENANMPEEIKTKAYDDLDKLRKTPTLSPEFSVNRTYLELLCSVPWDKKSQDNFNIKNVKATLDEDHYDLEKPKDRILEYISVLNMVGSLKKQILCFVGPPGVGKTSLGRSIAKSLGREFIRISLGGVRDEAEIRGHRRTYIGAMPGKIIQSMKKAGTINPVILLDEIDKMSTDFRGDPSSALLEVLDPEQNINFNDHYLEVDYDLSNVMFITTANVKYDIPLPLLDRLEVIELGSYLDPDKLEIAKRHILPKLKKELGLDEYNVDFTDSALMKIITEYTKEAGVRNLERTIASVLRKFIKELVIDFNEKEVINTNIDNEILNIALKDNPKFVKALKKRKILIDDKKIEEYLKAPKFKVRKEDLEDKIGVATGLAWTNVGGDTLPVEVTIMPGTEKLTLTGKLGDVMKESASAALSYIRSNYEKLGVDENFSKNKEIHIHFPEGAIPKDGPSAGITITLALISAARGIYLKGNLAMTGEVTLRGNVLPIGGLNEKLLAAKKLGITEVIVPKDNQRDVEEISDVIKSDLNIHFVKHIDEALHIAFPNFDVEYKNTKIELTKVVTTKSKKKTK